MSKRPLLVRGVEAELEVRGDGRTIEGVAVPYYVPATIHEGRRSYEETFVEGEATRV